MDDERTVTMTDHTILLVDDDRSLLEMLLSIFRRAGYTDILTASSGTKALRTWREAQPRLIVLDVMLPDMDGFCALREIRRTSRVPVLMLTARGEAEDRIEGLEIGADDYLAKPFLPRELLLRAGQIASLFAGPTRRFSVRSPVLGRWQISKWRFCLYTETKWGPHFGRSA